MKDPTRSACCAIARPMPRPAYHGCGHRAGKLGKGSFSIEERRIDRSAGEGVNHKQHHSLCPSTLGQVVVGDCHELSRWATAGMLRRSGTGHAVPITHVRRHALCSTVRGPIPLPSSSSRNPKIRSSPRGPLRRGLSHDQGPTPTVERARCPRRGAGERGRPVQ